MLPAAFPATARGGGLRVLVEEGRLNGYDLRRSIPRKRGLEPAAPLLDDLQRALQAELESGQPGVDVILGLVADLAALSLGR